MIEIVLYVFLLVLAVVGFCIFFAKYFEWCDYRNERRGRITFKEFIYLYNICPKEWELNQRCIYYYKNSYTAFCLEFETYIDYLRYRLFYKRKIAKEEKEERNKEKGKAFEYFNELKKEPPEMVKGTELK